MNLSRVVLLLTGIASGTLALWCAYHAKLAFEMKMHELQATYTVGGEVLAVLAVVCCALSQVRSR